MSTPQLGRVRSGKSPQSDASENGRRFGLRLGGRRRDFDAVHRVGRLVGAGRGELEELDVLRPAGHRVRQPRRDDVTVPGRMWPRTASSTITPMSPCDSHRLGAPPHRRSAEVQLQARFRPLHPCQAPRVGQGDVGRAHVRPSEADVRRIDVGHLHGANHVAGG